jgi:hypothetical protein
MYSLWYNVFRQDCGRVAAKTNTLVSDIVLSVIMTALLQPVHTQL